MEIENIRKSNIIYDKNYTFYILIEYYFNTFYLCIIYVLFMSNYLHTHRK